MIEIIKICIKCGELNQEQIYVRKSGRKECRICRKEAHKKSRINEKPRIEETRKYNHNYYRKNKSHLNTIYREYRNKWKKVARENLHFTYVKKLLRQTTNIDLHQISNGLVEAKRMHIKLKRKIKELKNVDK